MSTHLYSQTAKDWGHGVYISSLPVPELQNLRIETIVTPFFLPEVKHSAWT